MNRVRDSGKKSRTLFSHPSMVEKLKGQRVEESNAKLLNFSTLRLFDYLTPSRHVLLELRKPQAHVSSPPFGRGLGHCRLRYEIRPCPRLD
jgi:hypothetical protein